MRRISNRAFRRMSLLAIAILILAMLSPAAHGQMRTGEQMQDYEHAFGVQLSQRGYDFDADVIQSNTPGQILWPTEQPKLTFQIKNNLKQPLTTRGRIDVIRYGTEGIPGDIWLPRVVKFEDVTTHPIEVTIEAGQTTTIEYNPTLPETFGGYAFIVDLGDHGSRMALTMARTFRADPQRQQYPSFSLDIKEPQTLRRLGVQAIRMGSDYIPSDHPRRDEAMEALGKQLAALHEQHVTVMLMPGASPGPQPLGRPRPLLDNEGIMLRTKDDRAWMPENDKDFADWCYEVSRRWGWPNGPVTSFSLWNEPWEGTSISGWGADMIRFRELYTAMAEGIWRAREEHGVQVLVTGADSGANTIDKLFPDGSNAFLKYLDACTVHYHGINAPSLYKDWINRESSTGRVKIWDTESWIANTDDRIGIALAAMLSAGYDRTMGVYSGNIRNEMGAWSTAAAYGAANHFLGRHTFREILFKQGLPWVFAFDGPQGQPDHGTLVITAELGEVFNHNQLLFRTVRSLEEQQQKARWQAEHNALPEDATAQRQELQNKLASTHARRGGNMTIDDGGGAFRLYDFYGNVVPATEGSFVIPLNHQGFFLRTDASEGSFARLVESVRHASITGFEPVEIIAHDLLAPVEAGPTMRLELTNIYNRPIAGDLSVTLGKLDLEYTNQLKFDAHERKQVEVRIKGGASVASNLYPLAVHFDAGDGITASHKEDMRVNVIAHRKITVDGDLSDWKGVAPQFVVSDASAAPTMEEEAWFPFVEFDPSVSAGVAQGYLAYDDDYFYFAAKIADGTQDEGTLRFETRDDDAYFYPEVAYELSPDKTIAYNIGRAPPRLDEGFFPRRAAEGDERTGRQGWRGVARTFGFEVDAPDDRPLRVAMYYLHWKGDYKTMHWQRPRVLCADTGAELLTPKFESQGIASYFVLEVQGKVRIEFPANWERGQVMGIFLDHAPAATEKLPSPGARYVGSDHDTEGDWPKKYGRLAYLLPDGSRGGESHRIELLRIIETTALHWPEGVRRYSYRRNPILPSGNYPRFDNVQIAFNVVPLGEGHQVSHPPGTMPRYIAYQCTDYEYALNRVAEEYGGGTEIWRLYAPGMPRKHFYPRQPASPLDGAVREGKLVVTHEQGTRVVEAAIPWSELPLVRKQLDAGETIKFSFRVNDNGGAGMMELARARSVSRQNNPAFSTAWSASWANEVTFSFEPKSD